MAKVYYGNLLCNWIRSHILRVSVPYNVKWRHSRIINKVQDYKMEVDYSSSISVYFISCQKVQKSKLPEIKIANLVELSDFKTVCLLKYYFFVLLGVVSFLFQDNITMVLFKFIGDSVCLLVGR